jgi:hypothetical protein
MPKMKRYIATQLSRLKIFSTLVLLFLFTILTGCADFEAIATTPDGRILLLTEVEQDNLPDKQYLYVCKDLKGGLPQLNCNSNLQF